MWLIFILSKSLDYRVYFTNLGTLGQVSCGSLLIWVRILWDMGYLGRVWLWAFFANLSCLKYFYMCRDLCVIQFIIVSTCQLTLGQVNIIIKYAPHTVAYV